MDPKRVTATLNRKFRLDWKPKTYWKRAHGLGLPWRTVGEASRAAWANPDIHARRVKAISRALASPEVSKRKSESMKQALADPEVKKRISEGLKHSWKNPKVRKRRQRGIKRAWKKPELRRRRSEQSKLTWADPEYRNQIEASSKESWTDPEIRGRRVQGIKRALSKPKTKKRISRAVKRAWAADPKRRGDLSDRMKKHNAKVAAALALAETVPANGAKPRKRGPGPEPLEKRTFYLIGREVERLIPAMQKHDKYALIEARKHVAAHRHLQPEVVANYHKRFRRLHPE